MATTDKKYLSLTRLTEYDALIKAEIEASLASAKSYTDTKVAGITSGTTVVKEAEHATSADSAAKATQLVTSKNITLTGDASGSASFNGTADATITVTIADDSHNHIIGNVDGLQDALDGKAASGHNHDSAYYAKSTGEALASTVDALKEDVDTFFADADFTTNAKDTLKEIQAYITSDASDAADMLASINGKADKATTLSGYGITDTYTKTQVDSALSGKAASSDLTSHTGNTTVHITSTERTNWNAAYDLANTAKTNAATAQSAADAAQDTADEAKAAAASNTTAIGSNTSAISAHTTRITALETSDSAWEEITSEEIQKLFA